jgi:hypothetical protein
MIYLKTDDGIHGPIPIERWTQLEFGGKLPRNAHRADSPDGPWTPVFPGPTMEEIEAELAAKAERERRGKEIEQAIKDNQGKNARNRAGNAVGLSLAIVVFAVTGIAAYLVVGPFAVIPAAILSFVAYGFAYRAAS